MVEAPHLLEFAQSLGLRQSHKDFKSLDALLLNSVLASEASKFMLQHAAFELEGPLCKIFGLEVGDQGFAFSHPLVYTPAKNTLILHGPPALQDDENGDKPLGNVFICSTPIQQLSQHVDSTQQADLCLQWMDRPHSPFIEPIVPDMIMELRQLGKEQLSDWANKRLFSALIWLRDLTHAVRKDKLDAMFALVDGTLASSRQHAKKLYLTARLAEIQYAMGQNSNQT